MENHVRIRYTVNPELASEFAKHNCKKCFGRGIQEYRDIGFDDQPRIEYCNCVRNRMKLYRKN